MGLSEEDCKRIEEEELRRALRERYERELRVSADVRADTRSQVDVRGVSAHFVQADTSHQVEVRGVTTEIYRDAKRGAGKARGAVAKFVLYLFTAPLLLRSLLMMLAIPATGIVALVYSLKAVEAVAANDGFAWLHVLLALLASVGCISLIRIWLRDGN